MNNIQTIELLLAMVNTIDISEQIENNSYFELFVFKLPELIKNETTRTIILLDAVEINNVVLDILLYLQSKTDKFTKYQIEKKRFLKKRTSDYSFYKNVFNKLKNIIQQYRFTFSINDIDNYTKNVLDTMIEDIYYVFF